MKRIFIILYIGIVLNIIEYIILLFCFQLEYIIKYKFSFFELSMSIKDTTDIMALRFIFYFIFWIITIYLFYHEFNWQNKVLKFAIFNSCTYVFTSILMVLCFPFSIQYLGADFFYFLIIGTFISPFILKLSPLFMLFSKNIDNSE